MILDIESLSAAAKTALLTRIAHTLTVCARDTYEVGTENVLEPQVLRAYNELLHRVTGAVRDHLLGVKGYSLQTILEMMQAFGERHHRVNEMKWAIKSSLPKPID
jgi:hypothetical protein